ncbi:MAG: diacylglycerol kinase family protein [Gemmatimonadota bacterium]
MDAATAAIPVFLNANAGRSAADPHELRRNLGCNRIRVEQIPAAALAERVRAEADAGTPIVGIAGGDGTMSTAATVLAGTATVLLCVPTGTINSFANRIGIPDVPAAAEALKAGRTCTAVIGALDNAVFLNTVTLGEYARVVRMRERLRAYLGKWPAAAVAFATTLVSARMITLTLQTGDVALTRRTPFVWIGIGWGSFPRVPHAAERRASPDLEVAIMRHAGTAAAASFLFRVGTRVARGQNASDDRQLDVLHTGSLTIDAAHRIDATVDGETLRLVPPLRIGLHQAGLRVFTGPSSRVTGT